MATHELRAEVRLRPGGGVIDLVGDIDGTAEAVLAAAYERLRPASGDAVVLNFTDTDYINSTGIAVLVGVLAQARADRVVLGAFGLTAHYREIFEITRLSDFMTIADTEEGATRA